MINLKISNRKILKRNIERCRQKKIIIPTFQQMRYPQTVPDKITSGLKKVGLWEINPLNLFRITWKNEPVEKAGLYQQVNYVEIPPSLSGVDCTIIGLVGKWFPTGSHKVGATFGCIVPYLITGQFDATSNKAVWPSTGNYCRGGAYVASLLGCKSVAILPEEMSQERFDWLAKVAGEVIATPGCESNVKEIFDKCHQLRENRSEVVIFNQFDQIGNYLWHYSVTGPAIHEVLSIPTYADKNIAGILLTSGSSGTLGSADYLKQQYPAMKIAVGEAWQCPTLLLNGYGGHRIEGIGDKHVPWIHNVKNTDLVVDVDDEHTMRLLRLFNEPEGKELLIKQGVPPAFVKSLNLLGISSIANLIGCIKLAKYYELNRQDLLVTVFTDSFELYPSRIKQLKKFRGAYDQEQAIKDREILFQLSLDRIEELDYYSRKKIHNLKYYTWVEQQNKQVEELDQQWYNRDYWKTIQSQTEKIDELINEFNTKVGIL
ncbi:MAG: pyridoxal-5-phosphate-dependent protein subunit beta [Desulfuromonas sp. SDB]|nr:MAG: pyridoxal-5-phosphate-dependent protein subunit beta [Desulfuromonas sp. SDB]